MEEQFNKQNLEYDYSRRISKLESVKGFSAELDKVQVNKASTPEKVEKEKNPFQAVTETIPE